MQKYGKIKEGNLLLSSRQREGYKKVEYEKIPEFDQSTHYIVQGDATDEGEYIFVGVEMHELEIAEDEEFDEGHV